MNYLIDTHILVIVISEIKQVIKKSCVNFYG